jgi:hypothetical protein
VDVGDDIDEFEADSSVVAFAEVGCTVADY